jgi:hypothetical protein
LHWQIPLAPSPVLEFARGRFERPRNTQSIAAKAQWTISCPDRVLSFSSGHPFSLLDWTSFLAPHPSDHPSCCLLPFGLVRGESYSRRRGRDGACVRDTPDSSEKERTRTSPLAPGLRRPVHAATRSLECKPERRLTKTTDACPHCFIDVISALSHSTVWSYEARKRQIRVS